VCRLLRTQSLEWYYNNVKSRFKRFGSAKVLKTLYRKHIIERGALSELPGTKYMHIHQEFSVCIILIKVCLGHSIELYKELLMEKSLLIDNLPF